MTNSQPLTDPSTSTISAPAPSVTRPRRHLQRAGGIASLIEGGTYVAGFGVMLAYLAPRGFTDAQGDPAASLTFLLENQAAMYLWYLLIYLVAGAALVVLTLGIHDRLKDTAPALAQVAAAFGLIWSGLVLASGMVALVGQRAAVDLGRRQPHRSRLHLVLGQHRPGRPRRRHRDRRSAVGPAAQHRRHPQAPPAPRPGRARHRHRRRRDVDPRPPGRGRRLSLRARLHRLVRVGRPHPPAQLTKRLTPPLAQAATMSFRTYLRYDGFAGITAGAAQYTLGTLQGRQGHLDALIGG